MTEWLWKMEIKCPVCGKMITVRKKDINATLHDDYYYFVCKKCKRDVMVHVNILPLHVIEDADRRFSWCSDKR